VIDVASAAAMLEDIAAHGQTLEDIRERFIERVDEPDSAVARAVNWMLGYMLIESPDLRARSRYGTPFAPMWESRESVFPPHLDALPNREAVVSIWEEIAPLVHHSPIKGRVSDLLWCVGSGGDRHRHARNAIESYLSVAAAVSRREPDIEQLLDAVSGIVRGHELSLEINAPDLQLRVRERIAGLLRQELQSEEAGAQPGVWMRLFAPLVGLEPKDRPSDLGELVAKAHVLVTDNPDIRLALLQMQEQLARGDQSLTRSIRRRAVAMLIMRARQQTNGLARQHRFLEALELTRQKGVGRRTERRIRRGLQQIDPSSFDWQEYSSSSYITDEEIEEWIDSIVGDDGLESALDRFALAGGSPVGDRERTEHTDNELAQRFVLRHLVTRVVADEHGRQIRRAEDPVDKRSLDILEHEAGNVQLDGALRQLALDRMSARYATEPASLRRLFQTELIDAGHADAFARAFEHFWADRPDEALLVALPRIEAVLRKLLDVVGGVTYQPPRNHRPGRVIGMGEVLRGLEEMSTGGEEEWFRFFRVALTEPAPGLNLRNRHVHGLAEQALKQDAAIVLRIAALLRLVKAQGR